jgi:hypothetical protein
MLSSAITPITTYALYSIKLPIGVIETMLVARQFREKERRQSSSLGDCANA